MKHYIKPVLIKLTLRVSEEIAAGLTEWLQSNQLSDAGITTYIIQS